MIRSILLLVMLAHKGRHSQKVHGNWARRHPKAPKGLSKRGYSTWLQNRGLKKISYRR